jgi:hypothetical protein
MLTIADQITEGIAIAINRGYAPLHGSSMELMTTVFIFIGCFLVSLETKETTYIKENHSSNGFTYT